MNNSEQKPQSCQTDVSWSDDKTKNMKVHTVELKELQDFQTEQKVLFASSSKEQKKLYCTLRGSYEIWHYGVLVLETMQPYSAIEHYNSLEKLD